MFFGETIQDSRQFFFHSWQKYQLKQPLSPLEQQLVAVIIAHPEYHSLFNNPHYQDVAYFPEMGQTNPFLHLGLHLAVRDQIATDKPPGIAELYHHLLTQYQETLTVEHMMMECLAECLWQAQRDQSTPNEINYLINLKHLLTC